MQFNSHSIICLKYHILFIKLLLGVEKISMQLSKIEILNLWGNNKITLPLTKRITFLTGFNGSGKSTLLNIIYDALNLNSKTRGASTSKSRFWSAEAEFDNGTIIQSTVLPEVGENKSVIDKIQKLVGDESFHNIDVLHHMEDIYNNSDDCKAITHISYASEVKGELNLHSVVIPSELAETDKDLLEKKLSTNKFAFLFQEDRATLHNIEKSNIDFSLNYWGLYKNSIDERFCYIRDAVQIHESQVNKNLIDFMIAQNNLKGLDKSDDYKSFMAKSKEIKSIIKLLNSYFIESGKEITRDEDNKLTLRHIKTDVSISWHLLSRGEKTIIYLFFAIYMYKDKVEVFLLDEPEISLHVKWQAKLIKDLSEIASKSQFIIATHSPSLIKNNWLGNCLEISDAFE
jgi:predicted ATPase